MGNGLLANTTFATGPNDKLAVVDVYSKPNSIVVNSFQDLSATIGIDVNGILSGTNPLAIANIIKSVANGKLVLDPKVVLARMIGNNNLLGVAFRSLGASNANISISPTQINNVVATVNGTAQICSANDVSTINGLTTVINASTTGGNGYGIAIQDVGASAGLLSSVALQASTLGMPKVFSTMAANITNNQVLLIAATSLIANAIKASNIPLIQDIASTPIAKQIPLIYPNFYYNTTNQMVRPANLPQSSYPSYYSSLQTTYSAINPTYALTTRDSDSVINGYSLNGASSPFYTDLLKSAALSTPITPIVSGTSTGLYSSNSSAVANLTDTQTLYCANQLVSSIGPTDVVSSLSSTYPIVPTNVDPVSTQQDYSQYANYA